jgi:dihydroxyacetone kinase
MLDALLPFARVLRERVEGGSPLVEAWREAAGVAVERAAATADLRPKVGRARPLAEKSLGTPDAGATSMGMILTAVGDVLAERAGADATTQATAEGGTA